ncbi:pyridoxine biosynthesis protein PDX2, putative, partial [Hepatocystis sp. ex Piliocolobus tephrosceles]
MAEITIGVLALQGNFEKHISHFHKLQQPLLKVKEVRNKIDLMTCDGLVIPGGESTTLRKCLAYDNDTLYKALKDFIHVDKKPVWGTCCGCILLSNNVEHNNKPNEFKDSFSLGGLNISICRNYYGSQNDSFICSLNINSDDSNVLKQNLKGVCIRAPYIKHILSDN